MKQRLGVAAALLKDPELLILDEPTNGLDPAGMAEMRAFIRSLGDGGRTVVLSSHLMGEVEQVSDRVGVIRDGALVAEGTVEELRGRAGLRVRAEPAGEAARLIGALPGVDDVTRRDGVLDVAVDDVARAGDQPRTRGGGYRGVRAVRRAGLARGRVPRADRGRRPMTRAVAAELLVLRKRAATWILLGHLDVPGDLLRLRDPVRARSRGLRRRRRGVPPPVARRQPDQRVPVLRRRLRADARRVRVRERVRLGHAEDALHAAARTAARAGGEARRARPGARPVRARAVRRGRGRQLRDRADRGRAGELAVGLVARPRDRRRMADPRRVGGARRAAGDRDARYVARDRRRDPLRARRGRAAERVRRQRRRPEAADERVPPRERLLDRGCARGVRSTRSSRAVRAPTPGRWSTARRRSRSWRCSPPGSSRSRRRCCDAATSREAAIRARPSGAGCRPGRGT